MYMYHLYALINLLSDELQVIIDKTQKKGSVTCISDVAECDLPRIGLNNLHVWVTNMLI